MALLLVITIYLIACGAATFIIFAPRHTPKPSPKDVKGIYLGGTKYVPFK